VGGERLAWSTGLRTTPTWAVGLLVVAIGCSRGPAAGSAAPVPIESPEVTVEVENRNFSDATIYAVDGDLRVRLGRVTGKTTQTFTFRWYPEQLQMLVRFTGGGRVFSGPHAIVPGVAEELLLVIGVSNNSIATLTARGRG